MSKTIENFIWVLVAMICVAIVLILVFRPSVQENISAAVRPEAKLSLTSPSQTAVQVGQTQTVRWNSQNYSPATVKVNLIRKVASNPDRYEVVRTVASATKNDGQATWVPAVRDAGDNLFLEVSCVLSAQACRGTMPTTKLAVSNTGRYQSTANAFQAIESANNK